ncbi:MAG: mntH [Paucimonas sp.]|nr:mntH [Paucimonas sp.]
MTTPLPHEAAAGAGPEPAVPAATGPNVAQQDEAPVSWLAGLGPGLITGAADDDPSGIATYSQAGAQFGFNMLWTVLLTYPLMVSIQLVSARIGRVTGRGLATNLRRHFPRWLLLSIVSLLVLANTINIAADVSAMGEALHLLAGGQAHWHAVGVGLLSLLLQILIPYRRYVRLLKWLTLALLSYVATVFVVHIPWAKVVTGALFPVLQSDVAYVTTVVAVLGTTISPYLFFWQASQEVEDLRADPSAYALLDRPEQARRHLHRIRVDTWTGMGFSNLVAFFIMLTTAVTLHMHGVTQIETSADAAQALRPVAGDFAFALFCAGIVGTGLLAIPVLAGASAYAMAGAFRWKNSLEAAPRDAWQFYAIIGLSTAGGVLLSLSGIDPIKALYWSAVVNGVIAVPVMAAMMLMAGRPDIMGRFVVGRRLKLLGWLTTACMSGAVSLMFFLMWKGG